MSNKKTKAFGIIEVLIASMVIILVVFALTAIAQVTLSGISKSQDRTQAANLAAEGIEIVRQIRDTAWIAGDTSSNAWGRWMSGSGAIGSWSGVTTGSKYVIAYGNNHFYLSGPTSATETITLNGAVFTRYIQVDVVNSLLPGSNQSTLQSQTYKVTSVVTTPKGATIQVSEILTNWRPNY